jgi:hypothetical protein
VVLGLEFVDQIDDGRRFSRPRGTVEQQMRKIIFIQNVLKQLAVQGIQDNVLEM